MTSRADELGVDVQPRHLRSSPPSQAGLGLVPVGMNETRGLDPFRGRQPNASSVRAPGDGVTYFELVMMNCIAEPHDPSMT